MTGGGTSSGPPNLRGGGIVSTAMGSNAGESKSSLSSAQRLRRCVVSPPSVTTGETSSPSVAAPVAAAVSAAATAGIESTASLGASGPPGPSGGPGGVGARHSGADISKDGALGATGALAVAAVAADDALYIHRVNTRRRQALMARGRWELGPLGCHIPRGGRAGQGVAPQPHEASLTCRMQIMEPKQGL